jgi:protein phosphatase
VELAIPPAALGVLAGASGSGKSTFAAAHFRPTEIISSDACRALVSDNERDLSVSAHAFELMRVIADLRLRHGRLVLVDATNVRAEHRTPLVALARRHGVPAVAIVLDMPEEACLDGNSRRAGRSIPSRAVREQLRDLRESLSTLNDEGFAEVHVLRSQEEAANATVVRATVDPRS